MAITIKERPEQTVEQKHLRPGAVRYYVVHGTYDKLEAQLAIAAYSPAIDAGIDPDGVPITIFRDSVSIREKGGGVWEASVRYESANNTIELNVTFGTTTAKIFQAISHIKSYDLQNGGIDTDAIPNHDGVIGVNGQDVEGVDVEVGQIEFSIIKKYQLGSISPSLISTLFDFMGFRPPVNDATFIILWKGQTLSFPEGSLRLRTPGLKWTSHDEAEISYQFSYQKPIVAADNFTIASSDAITKEGQEYGWIEYQPGVLDNGTNQFFTRVPIAFHVEQVYPKKDFNLLDL